MMKKGVLILVITIASALSVGTILQHNRSVESRDEVSANSGTEAGVEINSGYGAEILENQIVSNQQEPTERSETEAVESLTSDESVKEEAALVSEPGSDADFVRVSDYIPSIYVDLRYAAEDNFTRQVIYDFSDAYLRYGTVKKLARVQNGLRAEGYSLKIWDAFRPVAAQYKLWETYPVDAYVANPNIHYSSHNRGNTVDITMVKLNGETVEMPTDFDDFSTLADRDYSDCSQAARENAERLERFMQEQGFNPYFAEWWHFSDLDSYEVEETFEPLPNMSKN